MFNWTTPLSWEKKKMSQRRHETYNCTQLFKVEWSTRWKLCCRLLQCSGWTRVSTLDHNLRQLRKTTVFAYGTDWKKRDNLGHTKVDTRTVLDLESWVMAAGPELWWMGHQPPWWFLPLTVFLSTLDYLISEVMVYPSRIRNSNKETELLSNLNILLMVS